MMLYGRMAELSDSEPQNWRSSLTCIFMTMWDL